MAFAFGRIWKETFGMIVKGRRRFAIKETQSREKSSQDRNVIDHATDSYDSLEIHLTQGSC